MHYNDNTSAVNLSALLYKLLMHQLSAYGTYLCTFIGCSSARKSAIVFRQPKNKYWDQMCFCLYCSFTVASHDIFYLVCSDKLFHKLCI